MTFSIVHAPKGQRGVVCMDTSFLLIVEHSTLQSHPSLAGLSDCLSNSYADVCFSFPQES